MSTELVAHKTIETEGIHDSEEYESAEEVDENVVEVYEDDDLEEEEREEDEEDDDEEKSVKEKILDGDEDKRNPQFIPKKGYFYEHDDRTNAPEEDEDPEQSPDVQKKEEVKPKKVIKELTNRWAHDMFDEEDQAPKTVKEVTERYGYDIRSDDQAPRARRRRRYGRGPNKYTPNWEEEETREKSHSGFRERGGRGSNYRNNYRGGSRGGRGGGFDEEFPELPTSDSTATEQSRKDSGEWNRNRNRNNADRDREYGNQSRDEERCDRSGRGTWRGQGWGVGQGGGRGRGRGRRNEFTNRNRYPDRRDSVEGDSVSSGGSQNLSTEPARSAKPQHNGSSDRTPPTVIKKPDTVTPKSSHLTSAPMPSYGIGRPSQAQSQSQVARKPPPPFTNTEYTGSASLTATRSQGQPAMKEEETGRVRQDARAPAQSNYDNEHDNRTGKPRYSEREDRGRAPDSGIFREREELQDVRLDRQDVREPGRYNSKGYQNDRRSQIPPRLQQQQQQINSANVAAKPKRFSTQRQRQTLEQNMANLSVSSGPPMLNQQLGSPGIAVSSVAGPQQLVTSAVPVPASVMSAYANHPPPQAYYEPALTSYEPQIYEATGNPITSGSNHTMGSTVSPALWGPLSSAYVTAPYPSPPTGQGVVPQQQYGDPSAAAFIAAAQSGGPGLYGPPHQFIQDPSLINYPPQGPPPNFAPPPFHPAGFQAFSQVAPAPPELYHGHGMVGGVTYYNTQNQPIRPIIPAPSKRPKSMLQLVEPPEKKETAKNRNIRNPVVSEDHYQHTEYRNEGSASPQAESQAAPTEENISYEQTPSDSISTPPNKTEHLDNISNASANDKIEKDEGAQDNNLVSPNEYETTTDKNPVTLTPELASSEELKLEQSQARDDTTSISSLNVAPAGRARKSPSPAPFELPDEKSWSEQMSDTTPINSPLEERDVSKDRILEKFDDSPTNAELKPCKSDLVIDP